MSLGFFFYAFIFTRESKRRYLTLACSDQQVVKFRRTSVFPGALSTGFSLVQQETRHGKRGVGLQNALKRGVAGFQSVLFGDYNQLNA